MLSSERKPALPRPGLPRGPQPRVSLAPIQFGDKSQPLGWLFCAARACLLGITGLGIMVGAAWAANTFLPAEEAFRLSVQRPAADLAELRFDIAPGYYLYREPLAVQAEGASVGTLSLPAGQTRYDENFEKNVETYTGQLTVGVPLAGAGPQTVLVVQSQGCAAAGLCYPLNTVRVALPPLSPGLAHADAAAQEGQRAVDEGAAESRQWPWLGLVIGLAAASLAAWSWRQRRKPR